MIFSIALFLLSDAMHSNKHSRHHGRSNKQDADLLHDGGGLGLSCEDAVWKLLETFSGEVEADVASEIRKDVKKSGGSGSKVVHWCSNCDGDDVVLDEGNYVCKQCGDILSRYIDLGAEWRFYGNEDSKGNDPTRCGLPTNDLLPDSSLGSVIGWAKNETHEIRVMRKYHMWNSMTYKERSLYNVFDTLTINAVNNGLSKSIIDDAKILYKNISEMKIARGENRHGLIASSIYMSCKRNKVPRSAKEIAKIFNLKTTTMTKGCKKFQDIMRIHIDSTTAEDFIGRFCSKMNMNLEMRNVCKSVVRKAEELGVMTENTPPSIAAGAIYLCNIIYGWGVAKRDMSDACEVSQVTISKCYKKLFAFKQHIMKLPADFDEARVIKEEIELNKPCRQKRGSGQKQSSGRRREKRDEGEKKGNKDDDGAATQSASQDM